MTILTDEILLFSTDLTFYDRSRRRRDFFRLRKFFDGDVESILVISRITRVVD